MHVSINVRRKAMPKGKDCSQILNVSDKASSAFDVEQDETRQKFTRCGPHWRAGKLGAG
jgi:hypothetical protein